MENEAAGGAPGSEVCRWAVRRPELGRIPTVMVRIIHRGAVPPRGIGPLLRYSRRALMPVPTHVRLRPILLTGPLAAALLVACGGPTSQTSPTPTPLSIAQIQTRYTTAANQYNHSLATIGVTENAACDVGSATATLAACQVAVSQQRQVTIAYDNALRATLFSG